MNTLPTYQVRAAARAAENAAAYARAALDRDPFEGVDLGRALAGIASYNGLREGRERECFDEFARQAGGREFTLMDPRSSLSLGFLRMPRPGETNRLFLPWGYLKRALGPTPGSKGGYLVGHDVLPAVDSLRPFSTVARLPVQTVELDNQASVPRVTGNISVTWQGDYTATVSGTDPAVGSISLTPRVAIALIPFSVQLQTQAPNLSTFIAQQLTRAVGQALDTAFLTGAGGAQPLGLLNQGSLPSVTGANLPWSGANSILRMRRTVADAGADDEAAAWLATPTVREVLAAREKVSTSGNLIWAEDKVDGRPAYVTPDLTAGSLLHGDFSRAVVAFFAGGIVIDVDPHNSFNTGGAAMRVQMVVDVGFLNIGAFCVATSVT